MPNNMDDLINDLLIHCGKPTIEKPKPRKKVVKQPETTVKQVQAKTRKRVVKQPEKPRKCTAKANDQPENEDQKVIEVPDIIVQPTQVIEFPINHEITRPIVNVNEGQSGQVTESPVNQDLTHQNDNPVQKLTVMNISAETFADCRITPGGYISVIDAIAKFSGVSKQNAAFTLRDLEVASKIQHFPKYKFSGQGARETPVAAFKDLFQILSQLPGDAAKVLRREQADISSRATAGDRDLEEAIADRRESVDPEFAELAMVGVERRRAVKPSVGIPGLYLIEVGRIGEIKADPLALPKRRKDILKLPAEVDDHVQYKFGFSKHLDTRMIQHGDNELKNTSIVHTWSWPASAGMLVDGENCIRDCMKELGGQLLAHTTDWPVMPPKYEDVMGDVVGDNVHRYLIDRDPHIQMGISSKMRRIEGESMEMRLDLERTRLEATHHVEIARLEAERQVREAEHQIVLAQHQTVIAHHQAAKLQLELDKMKVELQNSDLYHENQRYRTQIVHKTY